MIKKIYLLEVLQCSLRFPGLILSLSPPSMLFSKPPTLPHSQKLPPVTHILFFQTACKMMSRRCVVAEPVSLNKTNMYTTQDLLETGIMNSERTGLLNPTLQYVNLVSTRI